MVEFAENESLRSLIENVSLLRETLQAGENAAQLDLFQELCHFVRNSVRVCECINEPKLCRNLKREPNIFASSLD